MSFVEHHPKGLARFLADADLPSERLRIHISEAAPARDRIRRINTTAWKRFT